MHPPSLSRRIRGIPFPYSRERRGLDIWVGEGGGEGCNMHERNHLGCKEDQRFVFSLPQTASAEHLGHEIEKAKIGVERLGGGGKEERRVLHLSLVITAKGKLQLPHYGYYSFATPSKPL